MGKLRREMRRRMLGIGYCARSVERDFHLESICESCQRNSAADSLGLTTRTTALGTVAFS
jgi:hypothetical protein